MCFRTDGLPLSKVAGNASCGADGELSPIRVDGTSPAVLRYLLLERLTFAKKS
jgi:hypothetical protein